MAKKEPAPDHESASKMMEPKPASKGKGKMKLDDIRIRPAANGGFIATCSRTSGGGDMPGKYESKDYAFADKATLDTFLVKELA